MLYRPGVGEGERFPQSQAESPNTSFLIIPLNLTCLYFKACLFFAGWWTRPQNVTAREEEKLWKWGTQRCIYWETLNQWDFNIGSWFPFKDMTLKASVGIKTCSHVNDHWSSPHISLSTCFPKNIKQKHLCMNALFIFNHPRNVKVEVGSKM